ncbi:MAG TPA: efflux RND transporter periplasmic adaptor subunit [Fibrobacteria bacterium]|nr:efflux RND transporter periplasmic adaptor subunit [Fibrobacteria bacterium]
MKMRNRTLALLPAVVAAATLCSCRDSGQSKKAGRPAPSIAAWVARDTTVNQTLQGVGNLVPEAEVDLRVEIAGRVEKIGFREGQEVKQGQLLLKLVDADLAATRDKDKAVAQYQALTLQRRKQQLAVEAVAQQDVDDAANAQTSAAADLAFAEAQLAKAQIRAPFAGRIGLTNVAVGQYLTAGQTVASLARTKPLRVEFQVPGDAVSRVHPGMDLQFRPWGERKFRTAKIYATDPFVDSVSRSLAVRARWSGDMEGLVAGTAVEVQIGLSRARAVLMPPQGLTADAHGPSVLVLRGGKATAASVVVGQRTSDAVEIVSGVKAGDTVLCNGAVPVKPGSVVVPSRYL